MFKSIANWWNRDKIAAEKQKAELTAQLQSLVAVVEQLRENVESVKKNNEELQQELEVAEDQIEHFKQIEAEEEAKRNGTDPWVEIRSAHTDPVKGIQIELDWNEAFVQYLRDNGINGQDDETVVQKWLAFLYEDLMTRMETDIINTTDHGTVNSPL